MNFRSISLETMSNNAKNVHDKEISYTKLFLDLVNIGTYNLTTGYTLVNKIILTLMGVKTFDLNKLSKDIIPCSLFSLSSSYSQQPIETDNKRIIEDCRQEISKLLAVFIDLFTTDQQFRNKLLSCNNLLCLDKLLLLEEELINNVYSIETLRNIVGKIMEERNKIGRPIQLQKQIFTNSLQILGEHINNIVTSFEEDISLTLDVGVLVKLYNNIAEEQKLKKIEVPKSNITKSRDAIIMLPTDVEFPISNNIIVSNLHPNLESLTKQQLFDLLVYIDSRKDNFKDEDTRYAILSNKITYELSQRSKASDK